EMGDRSEAAGKDGLSVPLCEGTALMDRAGGYCFTGDSRFLPSKLLKALRTSESIQNGAWPFISPNMLDLRPKHGVLNVAKWPRDKDTGMGRPPLLLHVSALGYHYSPQVSASRLAEIWFGDLAVDHVRNIRSATKLVEGVFRELWIPQTKAFLMQHLRTRLRRGRKTVGTSPEWWKQSDALVAQLAVWEATAAPFSKE
ncbi:hypothetical protein K4F52_010387, partial [Lecanicillium sp. MT-2017a]